MPAKDASERSQIATIAAHTRWALHCSDRAAATSPARQAAASRWERQVDPAGELDPAERARRAESAKSAYFRQLALKSARKRRKSKAA